MEELVRHLLVGLSGVPAYLSVFGVLVFCGLGLPLPEDFSLIFGGYLAYLGNVRLPVMMAVGFAGILVGDSLIYLAGRRVGGRVAEGRGVVARLIARIVTPEKRARVEKLFHGHGEKIVMLARFLPGVRAVTYFTAGSTRMRYTHFIFFDGLAALASAPLFVFLGYHFGSELELITRKIRDGQIAVIAVVLAAVAGYLLFKRWRAAAQKREAPVSPVAQPVPAPQPAAAGRVSDATSG